MKKSVLLVSLVLVVLVLSTSFSSAGFFDWFKKAIGLAPPASQGTKAVTIPYGGSQLVQVGDWNYTIELVSASSETSPPTTVIKVTNQNGRTETKTIARNENKQVVDIVVAVIDVFANNVDLLVWPLQGTVVDNTDPYFFTTTQNWQDSGGDNPYGSNSVYSKNKPGNTAIWNTSAASADKYDVYASWTYWNSRPTNATYEVYNGNNLVGIKSFNQRDPLLGSSWNYIGTFDFDNKVYVKLKDNGDGPSYNADAVLFVKYDPGRGVISPTPALSGVIAEYKFENNFADSINEHDGTSSTGVGFVAGKVGQAAKFDGIDDYVSINPNILDGATQATIAGWINLNAYATTGQSPIIVDRSQSRPEVDDFQLVVLPDDNGPHKLQFTVATANGVEKATSVGDIPLNTWVHVAGVYDGSKVVVYINGKQDGSTRSISGGIRSLSNDLRIGGDMFTPGSEFNGLIDELRVYNKGLSSVEINDLYVSQGGTPPSPSLSGVIAEYKFEDNLADSVNEHDGTSTTGVGFVAGKVGQAAKFDGIDDYVSINPNILSGATQATIAGWINLNAYATTGQSPIIVDRSQSRPEVDDFQLVVLPDDNNPHKLNFVIATSNGVEEVASSSNIPLNTWVHVAGVYEGSKVVVYINGKQDGSARSISGGIRSLSNDLRIGGDIFTPGSEFNGLIDELRIYNKGLSSTEINDLYVSQGGSSPTPTPSSCVDIDKDGFGVQCYAGTDCKDDDNTVHQLAIETCGDNKDNNCDGQIDENCAAEGGTIVDDGDSGYSELRTWRNSSAREPYRGDSRYSQSLSAEASWTAPLQPGAYKVYTRWTWFDSRPTNAPYFVFNGNNQIGNEIRVNQFDRNLSNAWQLLGEFTFDQTPKVVLRSEGAPYSFNADAVSFVKAGNLTPGCIPEQGGEVCDGKDNDCDGEIDELLTTSYYRDIDGDTYGKGNISGNACANNIPQGHVANNIDCDDGNVSLTQVKNCGYNGVMCGTYQICALECPLPPSEVCGNGVDEDCNVNTNDICSGNLSQLNIFEPMQNGIYKNVFVPIVFNATGATNCWYELSGEMKLTSCNYMNANKMAQGNYVIKVTANNSVGKTEKTANFTVQINRRFVIKYLEFAGKGNTTNLDSFSDEGLANVTGLVFENDYGSIEFLEKVDLKAGANFITDVIDIDSVVEIGSNNAEIKTNITPAFNKKSRITFKGLSMSNPRILRDGNVCTNCVKEKYTSGTLVFTAPGFSNYSAQQTPDDDDPDCNDEDNCEVPNNDFDGDGIPNEIDNCLRSYNSDQIDKDGDGIGAVCDSIDNPVIFQTNTTITSKTDKKVGRNATIALVIFFAIIILVVVILILYVLKKTSSGGIRRKGDEGHGINSRPSSSGGSGKPMPTPGNFKISQQPRGINTGFAR